MTTGHEAFTEQQEAMRTRLKRDRLAQLLVGASDLGKVLEKEGVPQDKAVERVAAFLRELDPTLQVIIFNNMVLIASSEEHGATYPFYPQKKIQAIPSEIVHFA